MASFGENLRRERELRGVSLRDIADDTKISVRFLKALEEDRVDVLPGGLFPRAFVKQYATHLGLDADRLVAEFLYAHGEGIAEKAPPPRVREAPQRSGIFVLSVALVIGLLWLMKAAPPPPPGPVDALPLPSTLPPDRVYPSPAQAAAESPAEPEGLVLTLSARQNCWVEVQVDGQTVLNRVLSEGETQTMQAQGEIVLSVGNAGGLAFSVNDRPGVPLGRSGEVRKNIVITRKSLPTLVHGAEGGAPSHSG